MTLASVASESVVEMQNHHGAYDTHRPLRRREALGTRKAKAKQSVQPCLCRRRLTQRSGACTFTEESLRILRSPSRRRGVFSPGLLKKTSAFKHVVLKCVSGGAVVMLCVHSVETAVIRVDFEL